MGNGIFAGLVVLVLAAAGVHAWFSYTGAERLRDELAQIQAKAGTAEFTDTYRATTETKATAVDATRYAEAVRAVADNAMEALNRLTGQLAKPEAK